jgi:hypothetical protein
MPDPFEHHADAVIAPARSAINVVPSDTTDYLSDVGQVVPKGLYVGGAGTVRVRLVDDVTTVDFVAVTAGTLLPVRPRRILATGTTATNIVALD